MNNTKKMAFIAYSLMMNVVVYGMELEKLNEPSISQDRIFVWSRKDREYHAVTELGEVSEDIILQKNDPTSLKLRRAGQSHKIYRAQLIINKKEEGEEDYKYSLRTTQESIDGTETQWKNLRKPERISMPIASSQRQYSAMWNRLRSCLDKKKAVLVMDNDNNEYFITHIWDENRDNSKKVRVFDMEQCRPVQVPVLNKKKILLKLAKLEKEVEQLKQQKGDVLTAEILQTMINRRNRNQLIAKMIEVTSFFALIAVLYYACSQLVASNH